MKTLILKPSSLGDVVQALPVLRILKRAQPDSQIFWWIESGLAPLLEGDPDLAGVIPFHRQGWAAPRNWTGLWRDIRWMRKQNFDQVIDLQSLARSGAFAWLANGKYTVGLDEPREGARGFYDVIVPRASFYTHAVDWYLGAVRLLGVELPEKPLQMTSAGDWSFDTHGSSNPSSAFAWLPARPEIAFDLRRKWPVAQSQWLILQPGARWSNKRWPTAHFADLVTRLSAYYSELSFAILGSRDDQPLARAILQAAPGRCLDLTGQTTLPEMAEWIRLSKLMISNDTGPMHVGAALGKPVVALFGPTEPRRTGPYGQLKNVLQQPLACVPCMTNRCHNPRNMECLTSISPQEVFEAVQRLLLKC